MNSLPFRRLLAWWLAAYLLIALVNAGMTLGLGAYLAGTRGDAGYDLAYRWTVPLHLLVTLAAFSWAALRLWRPLPPGRLTGRLAVEASAIWAGLAVLVDAILFVGLLAETPAGAPADVFYVDNQPWTTLYYLAVAAGPAVARRLKVAARDRV